MQQTSNKAVINGPLFNGMGRGLINPFVLALLTIILVACGRSTAPGPNALGGSIDQTSYLLLDWPEGLRILIWDDVFEGGHNNHTESATNDPVFHQSGSAQSIDGRRYEYSLETRDGLQAEFTIDGSPYDLDRGKLFLIRMAQGVTQVEQLDLDLSGLSPTNAGIEDFGRQTTEIEVFIQSMASMATNEKWPGESGVSDSPPETTLPLNPLPPSLKGYVIQSHYWDGQWVFTLSVGLNAVNPCDEPAFYPSENFQGHTMKGVADLKLALDQLQPGQYVTWCSTNLPNSNVIEDIVAYSQQLGIHLSILADLQTSPTMTALAPVTLDPITTLDRDRRPDLHMTTSTLTPDNSLWYAFDKFDDAGGSYPYSPNQGLY
ncbi:MAG: hypothetical protein WA996_16200, partial [Candidatus Promineifilaceae bacterium]